MDYGNEKVSVGGLQQTFYSNLDSVHCPVTALLPSSKLPQNLKEIKRTYRCILRHDSPSMTLRRAAKTRCMKELGKGCLHILPARAEKDLKYLHWRAQQRSEQKVLGHLLKQIVWGQSQSRKQMGIKRFWVQLLVLVMHYLPSQTSNTRLQYQWLSQCPPCSVVIQDMGTWKDLGYSTGTDHPIWETTAHWWFISFCSPRSLSVKINKTSTLAIFRGM